MRILLTFTGYHDPFAKSELDGDMRAGPVLTVVAEGQFDRVYLFTTPNMEGIANGTLNAIVEKHPDIAVNQVEILLKDPTNYLGILKLVRSAFKKIHKKYPDADYSISVSSGTPQMHSCWLLLAASGEIPASILQSTPPEFVPEGKSQVRAVDLHKQGFPAITADSYSSSHDPDEEDLFSVCRELGIVGEDPAYLKTLEEAKTYAEYDDFHVLLLGETGSGKEYLASFIHRFGPRYGKAFIPVNCGGIPKELVESQLFGHKKGSFTGATADNPGKFKSADRGVLFLDELGELPMEAQAKLLRVLDQGEVEPIGALKPIKVDVRVIAATNRNLREMVAAGTFREDLYQRFGAAIEIPSLRERRMDITKLALHFLKGWNAKYQKERRLSHDALTELTRHTWPGNVRELSKVIVRSAMLCSKVVIGPKDLQFEMPLVSNAHAAVPEPEEGFDISTYLEDLKAQIVKRAMVKADGKQAKAARLLGWSPQGLNQYLKKNGAK